MGSRAEWGQCPFRSGIGTPIALMPIDRLTHHAAIVKIARDSYRLREAERHQKARRTS